MTARAKQNDAPSPRAFNDGDRLINEAGDVAVRIQGRWHAEATGVPLINVTDADMAVALAAGSMAFAPAEPIGNPA